MFERHYLSLTPPCPTPNGTFNVRPNLITKLLPPAYHKLLPPVYHKPLSQVISSHILASSLSLMHPTVRSG